MGDAPQRRPGLPWARPRGWSPPVGGGGTFLHPMTPEARRQWLEGALADADERQSRDLLARWTYSSLVQVQRHFPPEQGTLGLWASRVAALEEAEIVRFVADPEAQATAVRAAVADRLGCVSSPPARRGRGVGPAPVAATMVRRPEPGPIPGQRQAAQRRRRRRPNSRGAPTSSGVTVWSSGGARAGGSSGESGAGVASSSAGDSATAPPRLGGSGRCWRSGGARRTPPEASAASGTGGQQDAPVPSSEPDSMEAGARTVEEQGTGQGDLHPGGGTRCLLDRTPRPAAQTVRRSLATMPSPVHPGRALRGGLSSNHPRGKRGHAFMHGSLGNRTAPRRKALSLNA